MATVPAGAALSDEVAAAVIREGHMKRLVNISDHPSTGTLPADGCRYLLVLGTSRGGGTYRLRIEIR